MTRNVWSRLALLFGVLLMIYTPARAQEFQHSYKLAPGGSLSIRNVSGDVNITGYDGDVVTVSGFKEGRDRDMVEVEDRSSGNSISLGVRYPSPCNCDASVRFEVRIPRSINVYIEKVSTASGNIEVNGVRGEINVSTASGDVTVNEVNGRVHASTASGEMRVKDVVGEVSAQSASGDVEVEIAQLTGTEDMKFSSASGDVHVRLPANLDADISMSTSTGDIRTDFPIQVKESRYGPGAQARARLGSGSRSIQISTASGNVSLMRY
ncbi:MAG: DUF4097 family beta strand repeat protein [Acidobacteria bacterium]|nr:DUF4097 family beta strand repeat protein [Acidobacteriota bacterium]